MSLHFDLPAAVVELIRAIRSAGGRPYLVGGVVRDALLGLPVKDLDIEVYDLEAERLARVLSERARVEAVGQAFAVYKVAGLGAEVDVSLPRRDSKIGRGHRGFAVVGDPDLSIAEAARRRDFTINALLADPESGELVDVVGGVRDLERRMLRVVDPTTFGEDSLRVLRGAQLAARFGLRPDAETERLCRSISLADLPAERVSTEMEKLLLQAPRPSIGWRLLRDWGRLGDVAPQLLPTIGCPQEPSWHPEGDVFVHTLLALDRLSEVTSGDWGPLGLERRWTVALAVLAHDLGKPSTTARLDGRWRSYRHDEAGVAPTLSLLDRWNVHSRAGFDVRRQVAGLVLHHLRPGQFHDRKDEISDGAFRRLATACELDLLARVAAADSLGRAGAFDDRAMRWFAARARELAVAQSAPPPLLLGRHLLALGAPPGPRVGEILRAVYERQLDGEVTDLERAIEVARRLLLGRECGG